MKKYKVYSSQYSYFFGNNQIHFPYSIATIISYSKQFKEVDDGFEFKKCFLKRDGIEEDIKKCADADILLCSCYCWNWEITNKLAKEVKKTNPKCLIIFGGPEVPDADRHNGFFDEYPYVDVIVHGEGEIVLYNILSAFKNGKDIYSISGTENANKLNLSQERIKDLDTIPSPYSTNVIWDLVEKDTNTNYIVSWETNRGCPHSCTFCFSGDTLVIKEDKIIRLREEEFIDEQAICEEGHNHFIGKNDKSIISKGEKDCLKITVSNGTFLKITPGHEVHVIENDEIILKPVSELKVSDWVPILTGQNKVKKEVQLKDINELDYRGNKLRGQVPKVLNEDLAWIIGLLIGDGTIRKNRRSIRYVASPPIEKKIVEISKKLFDLDAHSYSVGKNTDKVRHVEISSTLIVRLFESLNVGRLEEKLKVPEYIFNSPANVVRSFLDGLWRADGYDPKTISPPYLTTTSHRLAEECAALIIWIGDIPKIVKINSKKYKPNVTYNCQDVYRIEWHSKNNRERDSHRGTTGIVNQIPLSYGLTPSLKVVKSKGWNGRTKGTVHRARLRRFDPKHALLQENVYFVQVTSVENFGMEKVYDVADQPNHLVSTSSILARNCDWGSATKSKIRNFSIEKLYKEIEWMGDNNILYVDCCDGNFGIFAERDYDLAKKISDTKRDKGFPNKIGITWTKGSSEKIISIAKELLNQDLLRAVSLSVQSLDKETLKIIKRTNIKFDKFEDLVKKFEDEGLQTYTELIMGLPGETLDSFKKGWAAIADIYPPPSVMAWNCSVFVNAPMNDEMYKKIHGIEVFKSPVFLAHTSANKKEINEYEKMIRHVSSLRSGELNKVYLYNWMMIAFHSFGLIEYFARYFNTIGLSYINFYDYLMEYCLKSESSFNEEVNKVIKHAENGYSGNGWDYYDDALGDISWPIEEASYLNFVMNKNILKEKIDDFLVYLKYKIDYDEVILNDLKKFQLFCINSPNEQCIIEEEFEYDWKIFFMQKEQLGKRKMIYQKKPLIMNKNIIEWCYQAIWWGRRQQMFKTKLKDLEIINE